MATIRWVFAFAWMAFATTACAQCAGFSDVSAADTTYCTAVTYLKTKEITLGCGDGTKFCPLDYVTRQQMALFLQRAGQQDATNTVAFWDGATVGGGINNQSSDTYSTVGGGGNNVSAAIGSTVSGGVSNEATDDYATVSGGGFNTASGYLSTVAGGRYNTASASFSSVGAGTDNTASGVSTTVAGGSNNIASANFSSVVGGVNNTAAGASSTVAGGQNNSASKDFTFAAGRRAKATTQGSFVWADSRDFDFQPSVSNFFAVRATGGVGLVVAVNSTTGAVSQYCNLLPGVASWQCTSDRDAKENFVAADGDTVLQKLVDMPLYSWNFKDSDPSVRLLGPTAQDFWEAFHLGRNDKMIVTANTSGVALAAIKGLNAKVEAQARELAQTRVLLEQLLAERASAGLMAAR